MAVNRKEFIKKACLSGACLCGFASIAASSVSSGSKPIQDQKPVNPNALQQEWISVLLSNIDDNLSETELRNALKGCAIVHYNNLNMDSILAEYKGNLDKFITFLSTEWGWKIDYDKTNGVIIADENKNYCVCPMINKEKGVASAAICYCSEGFSEKMFSEVAGKPVKATVLTSIYRGDPSCRYKVVLS
jgi:hypothetical protein